jgi:hypothetical protein
VESVDPTIAGQQHGKLVSMAMDMHETIEELLDMVFSMPSLPRLYNKDTN